MLASVYYATITVSTTGYGDIVPVTDSARLVNTVLITPIRVIFLIVTIVAAVREEENRSLLLESGADHVVLSSDAAGQMLAISAIRPAAAKVIADLMGQGRSLDLYERPADDPEVGDPARARLGRSSRCCAEARCWHLMTPGRRGLRKVTC